MVANYHTQRETVYTQPPARQVAPEPVQLAAQFVTIDERHAGQRLDNFLAKLLKNTPRTYIQRIIRSGEVRINKGRVAFDSRVLLDDVVRVPPLKGTEKTAESIQSAQTAPRINATKPRDALPFAILYEDEHLLAIDKPSGWAVHGGSGVNLGVIEVLRQHALSPFLELAHRIDRDTSGILIVAKRRPALVAMQEQLRAGTWKKHYRCVVQVTTNAADFVQREVKLPLLRTESANGDRLVRVDEAQGQFALSRLRVLRKNMAYAELQVRILTGRTHQIRVHCAHIGLPLLGDDKYGDFALNKQLAAQGVKRLMLHAHTLELIHPVTQAVLQLTSPIPKDYAQAAQRLLPQA